MYRELSTFKPVWALVLVLVLAGCSSQTRENIEPANCEINPPDQPVACTMQYDPVCGCDGKTYSNACMARGAGVPDSSPGACEESINN